eukprot:s261_g10.t1
MVMVWEGLKWLVMEINYEWTPGASGWSITSDYEGMTSIDEYERLCKDTIMLMRPSSVPADRRQSGRSSGPRLDSRSPRRSAAAERWPTQDGQGNSLDVKLKGDIAEEVEDRDMAPSMVEKSHLWRLVEEVTDFRFGAESDRVALDSMRWQRLTSRLRRQEGRNLPWDAQRRCGTLGELLREIESLPVVQGCEVQPREMEEVAGWSMMWGSKCLW